jgi:hypothetical protein
MQTWGEFQSTAYSRMSVLVFSPHKSPRELGLTQVQLSYTSHIQ